MHGLSRMGLLMTADPMLTHVRAVAEMERTITQHASRLDRLSDAVAAMAGSRVFIVGHAAWFDRPHTSRCDDRS